MSRPHISKRSVAILGTSHVLPSLRVTSAQIDQRLGLAPGTVEEISGVHARYVAGAEENAAQLAALAGQKACMAAGLALADIDCVVAVSATMDQGMPCNAALVHATLGLSPSGIPAFDINASCLGFIAALDTLSWLITAGRYRHILIVAADLASCGLNWQDLKASAIFGDGAAAAVLGPTPAGSTSHIIASALQTYSEGVDFCGILGGGSRYHPTRIDQPVDPLMQFYMEGKKIFRLASQHLSPFVEKLLAEAALDMADIDWIVLHQASQLAIQHMTKRLGFAPERVINIFAEHGNQVAASLPTTLDIAIGDGRIQRGQKVLLLGTGAGLSIGGVILEF